MPSRINNIFGTTDISRRFRPQGESDGWAFYLLDLPYVKWKTSVHLSGL
ncbi:hypothetical protein COO91_04719 [Nostoc flagelliforme CCNUN1]|uniref:Uncharacterized protein n=1 Tax=Nostoc flagelliforme CCNUN1 TaxID=2038116 RepID=A0A2K8STF4_9NOSO|nr:hypothetical protein [Nostoc flagelliforme]AUB38744.1 hypothetical protein COO91_04719 [Nostoc flagelliforme CCNUN1]